MGKQRKFGFTRQHQRSARRHRTRCWPKGLLVLAAAAAALPVGMGGATHAGDYALGSLSPDNRAVPDRPLDATDWRRSPYDIAQSGPPASTEMSPASALSLAQGLALNKAQQLLPSLGGDAPDWAKRIEIEGSFFDRGKGSQSILTVQPLYQSPGKVNTVFVQGSVFRYSMYGEYRITGNLGLGYRRLFADNTVMAGVNAFIDDEFTNNHRRDSIGGEIKWGPLDFGTNLYRALSGERQVGTSIEQALNGWDAEIGSQIPYLPWAEAFVQHYYWQKHVAAQNVQGNRYSADFALHPNVTLEIGRSDDNFQDLDNKHQDYLVVRFHLASLSRPTLTTGPVISDAVFEARDLGDHTLDKVRRENRIIVERRTTGGVIVGRGN